MFNPFSFQHETHKWNAFHSGFVVFVVASTLFTSLCAALFASVLMIGLYGAPPHTRFQRRGLTLPYRDVLEHGHRSSHRLVGLDLNQYRVGVYRVAAVRPRESQRQGGCFTMVSRDDEAFQTPEGGRREKRPLARDHGIEKGGRNQGVA